ncbi:MAG TPA: hypothetical protein VG755_45720 [Nannocystaceae bacterium]|nr:hypothetical protein [Nannocystaceae bacterium]
MSSFEVVDALGLVGLARRSADLEGSIPLRAARACVPLLEGNAFGWLVQLRAPLVMRRRRGSWTLDDEAFVRRARACVPILLADGWLAPGAWAHALARGPLVEQGGRLLLWTGLLVRGATLWIGSAGGRRNRDVDVGEVAITEGDAWVPLVLELTPARGVDRLELVDELATIARVDNELPRRIVALADARDVGAAHLHFYDASYFAEKREGPTKKYRRLLADDVPPRSHAEIVAVAFGPRTLALEPCAREHAAAGPRDGSRLVRFVFRTPLAFSARYDGQRVQLDYDKGELARAAATIEAEWTSVFGTDAIAEHRGALWYLTKYFTPHVAGEPHFFVKPWALCASGPGVSLLVDGIGGPGFDVLRGVIRSDRFGATPAVFALWGSGTRIEVARGQPLVRLLPFVHDDEAPRWHEPLPTAARS